jgi:antitoxin CptB
MGDLETRRRRAQWRAEHRGTKEMDLLLGRFASDAIPVMDDAALSRFEAFLQLQDPELQRWILNGEACPAEAKPLVDAVRAFHGLGETAAT